MTRMMTMKAKELSDYLDAEGFDFDNKGYLDDVVSKWTIYNHKYKDITISIWTAIYDDISHIRVNEKMFRWKQEYGYVHADMLVDAVLHYKEEKLLQKLQEDFE